MRLGKQLKVMKYVLKITSVYFAVFLIKSLLPISPPLGLLFC